MKVKNVVIVNDFNYVQGGASKVAKDTAKLLKNKGINVIFFSAVNKNEEKIDGVTYISTNQNEALKEKNKLKGIVNGIYNFKAKIMFKKLLKTLNKEDTIIHVHGWTKALSSSVFHVAFKMQFKTVLTLHDYFTACPNGGYFNYKQNIICKYKPLSWKCIKCNCDSRNYGFKLYRIIRQFVQNKIVNLNKKLKNVILISNFSENILRNTLNKNINIYRVSNPIDIDKNASKVDYKKNDYFLYVGRVSKEKGVDIFCNAVSKAKVKGVVVGDGSELSTLKEQFPNIVFTGWKKSEEVKKYMQKARALVIPSRWYEGAPLTPLEAMQYGIPIISSDCNATVDYINEKNGIAFNMEKNNLEEILIDLPQNFKPSLENLHKNYVDEILKVYNVINMKKEGEK